MQSFGHVQITDFAVIYYKQKELNENKQKYYHFYII